MSHRTLSVLAVSFSLTSVAVIASCVFLLMWHSSPEPRRVVPMPVAAPVAVPIVPKPNAEGFTPAQNIPVQGKLDARAQELAARWLQPANDLAGVADADGALPQELTSRMERAAARAGRLAKSLGLAPNAARMLVSLLVRYELRQTTFIAESKRRGGNVSASDARAVAARELAASLRLTPGLGPEVERAVTPGLTEKR